MSKKVSILVLDYLKPLETRNCLRSIKDACRFDHQVIFYANGGDPSYSQYYQEQGLIDILISNKENIGCGPATIALFKACDTDYAIYLQQDQAFGDINIDQSMINSFKEALNKEMKDGNVRAISFAGYPAGENTYSERCHLINTKYYNDIPKTDIGGPGITNDKKYTEQVVQEYFEANGHRFIAVSPPLIVDSGKWSVRELPDGSISGTQMRYQRLFIVFAHPYPQNSPKCILRSLVTNGKIWL